MENQLISEYIATQHDAKVIVLFGGNPLRRDAVIRFLSRPGNVSIYGTLSEEEGINKLREIPRVDLVLIGGRYSAGQRTRIRSYVAEHFKGAKISEPGYEYAYDNEMILNDIRTKLTL